MTWGNRRPHITGSKKQSEVAFFAVRVYVIYLLRREWHFLKNAREALFYTLSQWWIALDFSRNESIAHTTSLMKDFVPMITRLLSLFVLYWCLPPLWYANFIVSGSSSCNSPFDPYLCRKAQRAAKNILASIFVWLIWMTFKICIDPFFEIRASNSFFICRPIKTGKGINTDESHCDWRSSDTVFITAF